MKRGPVLRVRSIPRSARQHGDEVGLREVITLEQQRLVEVLGERIGKAVARIEASRMPASAEA
jgi:hypothetical protein